MSEAEIRTKRVYEQANAADGTRVLVDRLWPRGVSHASAALDLWLADIAPTPALRTWFGHDPARFAPFRTRYEKELDGNGAAVDTLLALTGRGRLTLLYAAHDRVHNHAVVLADYLRARAGRAGRTDAMPEPAAAKGAGAGR